MENLSKENLQKQRVLLSCIDVEMAAAEIYRYFMQIFPYENDFWEQMAREEEDHARLYVGADILRVTGEYSGIKLPPPAFIGRTLLFAEQIKGQIRSRPITLKEATEMALMLERTLAESIVFELPDGVNPIIANLRRIIDETEAHVERIERFRIEKGFTLPG